MRDMWRPAVSKLVSPCPSAGAGSQCPVASQELLTHLAGQLDPLQPLARGGTTVFVYLCTSCTLTPADNTPHSLRAAWGLWVCNPEGGS